MLRNPFNKESLNVRWTQQASEPKPVFEARSAFMPFMQPGVSVSRSQKPATGRPLQHFVNMPALYRAALLALRPSWKTAVRTARRCETAGVAGKNFLNKVQIGSDPDQPTASSTSMRIGDRRINRNHWLSMYFEKAAVEE
jgi:hypothetical protein